MTIYDMIEVLQAAKEGKRIRRKRKAVNQFEGGLWMPFDTTREDWDFGVFDFDVAPEPRERWTYQLSDGSLGSLHWENPAFAANYGEPILLREVL